MVVVVVVVAAVLVAWWRGGGGGGLRSTYSMIYIYIYTVDLYIIWYSSLWCGHIFILYSI